MPEAKRDEVPLPEKNYLGDDVCWGYDEHDMREYGRQCAQAERERCAQVVETMPAYRWVDGSDQWGNPCPAKLMTRSSDYAAAIRSQNLIKE